jgi:hypothetical protein
METKKATEVAPKSLKLQCKDKHFDQLKQTQIAFFSSPATMMQVARQIGCDRANVCWYVRELRKAGAIWLVRKGRCPVTGWPYVGYWTTDPRLSPKLPVQLSLFEL